MKVVENSGTAFAYPSQTLYLTRDSGLDVTRTKAAEAQLKRWREEGRLEGMSFQPETARCDPEWSAGR